MEDYITNKANPHFADIPGDGYEHRTTWTVLVMMYAHLMSQISQPDEILYGLGFVREKQRGAKAKYER
jgi:hypothetical protein